jgi:hypothetical protein
MKKIGAIVFDTGASSGEGAFSTARCRVGLPDLQIEEFRMNPKKTCDRIAPIAGT